MNTTYFLNLVAGNVFKTKTSPAIPTSYYLGLSKSEPNLSGGNVSEPSGSSYARVLLQSTSTSHLSTPSDGVVQNKDVIEFPESSGNWGKVTHFVIYDAETNGNLLIYGPLSVERTVEQNTIVIFRVGDIKLNTQNPQ